MERKKYQFLVIGGGIASAVAPLNFLPGTGIYFPPLAAFAVLVFFYFVATGILHLHFFELPDIVGRGILLVIQVFAFAVVFGVLEVVSGRKFWFPLAGVFLISIFLLTFYPFLMRKLGGISSDLLVRQSRQVQSVLSDFARKLPESQSLPEIARNVEEALSLVPFIARASLWVGPEGGTDEGIGSLPVRPEEYLRAFSRFSRRYPVLRVMEHGGSKASDVSIWDDTFDASIPVFLRGNLVAVVLFHWREKRPSFREMELLFPFLDGIGLAVENLRQQQRIQRREHFATIGELAAGLAHEVRTPVGAIKGAAQFLTRDARAGDREFLDIIVEEADRLNGVVTEFLEYARPSERKPRKLSLQEPVEKAVARLLREKSSEMGRVRRHVLVQRAGPLRQRGPRGNRAGGLQSPYERRRGDAPRRGPDRPRELRRGKRPDRRGGHGPRDLRVGPRPPVPSLLHHAGARGGHGAGDLPADRRGERRVHLGGKQPGEGEPLRREAPGGIGGP